MAIYFSNPGTIDLRLLSTFGVNVKPNSSNPIGHFGTGLKYAIAGVLRLGGTVQVHQGEDSYNFFSKDVDYRGKIVSMVHMEKNRGELADAVAVLPFSTSLGAHWEPWMLYREFYSNAVDEGGGVGSSYPTATCKETADVVFCVQCPEVEAVLAKHNDYFLGGAQPLATLGNLELHPGRSPHVFYKGIKVFSHTSPLLHTYNFLSGLSLTEDRTVSEYSIRAAMVQDVMQAEEEHAHYIKEILEANITFESGLPFEYSYGTPSPGFKKVMASCYRGAKTNDSARAWAKSHMQEELGFATRISTQEEQTRIRQALSLVWTAYEMPVAWGPLIFLSEEVGEWRGYGMAVHQEAIYIHPLTAADPFLCFKALLEAYHDYWLEESKDANEKLIWKLLGQEAETPAESPAESTAAFLGDEILF